MADVIEQDPLEVPAAGEPVISEAEADFRGFMLKLYGLELAARARGHSLLTVLARTTANLTGEVITPVDPFEG